MVIKTETVHLKSTVPQNIKFHDDQNNDLAKHSLANFNLMTNYF